MTKPRIGIVISAARMGRFADKPVEWLWNLVSGRSDMEFEIVDLRRYPLPFSDEPMSPAWGAPKNEVAQRWATMVAHAMLDELVWWVLALKAARAATSSRATTMVEEQA